MAQIKEPRHPEFEKIYQQFQTRYCMGDSEETSPKGGPCRKGDDVYNEWLKTMGLDDTRPYGEQVKPKREQFKWAEPTIQFLKMEEGKRLYKCEALMPLSSMNDNLYTEDELIRSARTLKGKVPNLNHTEHFLDGVLIEDSEYETGAVETIISVREDAVCPVCPNKYKIVDMLDHIKEVPEESHIYHVSIEATCRSTEPTDQGNLCQGLIFTGIALLTKNVLPGVPLTRIMPVEAVAKKVVEAFNPTKKEYDKAPEDTSWDFDASKYDIDQLKNASAVVTGPSGVDGQYTKDDCHLPHHLPGDGKSHGGTVVWRGVAAAGAALQGGRGGVKLSPEDKAKAKNHLEKHYREFDKETPWSQEGKIPTKPDLIARIKELKAQGLSGQEAWRLASFELLDWISKYGGKP